MGIDFNNLISFGKHLAKFDGGNNDKVIEGAAIEVFKSAVDNTAQSNGIDASEIYNNTDIASLMGAEFGNTNVAKNDANKPVFSDEDISLENLMSLIDTEVAEYDENGNAVLDANGNPVTSSVDKSALEGQMAISEMTHAGVPYEMATELAESGINTHKVVERMAYMTENIISNGVVDNAQYGEESPIANLISYLVADGYLS